MKPNKHPLCPDLGFGGLRFLGPEKRFYGKTCLRFVPSSSPKTWSLFRCSVVILFTTLHSLFRGSWVLEVLTLPVKDPVLESPKYPRLVQPGWTVCTTLLRKRLPDGPSVLIRLDPSGPWFPRRKRNPPDIKFSFTSFNIPSEPRPSCSCVFPQVQSLTLWYPS